jgi:hypothetical protein
VDGEKRGKKFFRNSEHLIEQSAVKVDVGAYAFVNTLLFRDDDRRERLNLIVKGNSSFLFFSPAISLRNFSSICARADRKWE